MSKIKKRTYWCSPDTGREYYCDNRGRAIPWDKYVIIQEEIDRIFEEKINNYKENN